MTDDPAANAQATDDATAPADDSSAGERAADSGRATDSTDDEEVPGPTVLVVDNYDSFAYNLVQYVGEVITSPGPAADADASAAAGVPSDGDQEAGPSDVWLPDVPPGEVIVKRNDEINVYDIGAMKPDAIIVSPGPGTPEEAGVSMPIFKQLRYPTLGVCLGHQALCAANGAAVGHADEVVHGKPSTISHDGQGVFRDLPENFEVGRYHSLAVGLADVPDCLTKTALTEDERSVVMGVRHDERPHVGVQFHPESILTEHGKQMIATFTRMALEGSL